MAINTTDNEAPSKELQSSVPDHASSVNEKEDFAAKEKHLEIARDAANNLIYENDEEEPEIHLRTWIALASMWLLNYVQVVALQGPPAVVCTRYEPISY